MEKYEAVFRRATLDDDVCAIARYIYLTDPYIYPAICDSPCEAEWVDTIRQCLQQEDNLFSYRNIFVALLEDKIVGICCVIPGEKQLNFAQNLKLSKAFSSRMQDAINGYFLPLLKESSNLSGYNVTNLCIDENFRCFGLGKGLLDYSLSECKAKTVYLDVIADNASAIRVYRSLNFKVEKEYEGFCDKNTSILCYRMKRAIE